MIFYGVTRSASLNIEASEGYSAPPEVMIDYLVFFRCQLPVTVLFLFAS
jgi:hypothetical protein